VIRLRRALPVLLLLAGCTQTALTWRGEDRFAPLPPDAEVRLYVRSSAPDHLREELLARGAEEVSAFPPGIRVAEIAAKDAVYLSWDAVLEDVRERARALGADGALATGGVRAGATEAVVYFQLVRSSFALDTD
jgi:hypothetical protein